MTKAPRRMIESSDVEIDNAVITTSIEDTAAGRTVSGSGIVTEPIGSIDLGLEAFMAQPIDVMLMEPTDPNEEQFAQVTVNGIYKLIPRDGNVYTIPRSHVEALCNAKPQRISQQKTVTGDGEMIYREQKRTGLAYPFSVVSDPAGVRGNEWLRGKLKAAAA